MSALSLFPESFRRQFARWRRHAPAVQLALAVALGQGVVWCFEGLWLALVMVGVGVALIVPAIRGYVWLAVGILVGMASALLVSSRTVAPLFFNTSTQLSSSASSKLAQPSEDLTIFGTVASVPRHPRPGEITFEVRTETKDGSLLLRYRAVELPWRNAAVIQPGDGVWVRGTCEPVRKPLNPFTWDGWLWRRGVAAECKARFVSQPVQRATPLIYQLRDVTRERVINQVGDVQGAGLFLSMALGYHDLLSVPLEQAFTRLGLTHLLVVSGYQVSLTFGFILSLATLVVGWLRFGGRYLKACLTVIAFISAAFYVVFIGAEMSAVRALLAAACVCAHLLSERETSFAQRWGVALFGMQLLWPWCAFDIGVLLTFAALLGIGLGSGLAAHSRAVMFCAVTGSVWLCTSFIVVVWQGTLSPLGLVLNLVLAAPWSILNCTVGLTALGMMLTGIPGSDYPLRVIVWLNQTLSEAVLALGEASFGSWRLEGLTRIVASGLILLSIAFLVRQATRSKQPLL